MFVPRKNTSQNLLRIQLSKKRVRKARGIRLTWAHWSEMCTDWNAISLIECEWDFVWCYAKFFGKHLIWCLDFLSCPFPVASSSHQVTSGDTNPSSWYQGHLLFLFWRLENYFSVLTLYPTSLLLLSRSQWCGPCLILHRYMNFHLFENCCWNEIWWRHGWSFLLGPKKQTVKTRME